MTLFQSLGFELDADLRPFIAKMGQAKTAVGAAATDMTARFSKVNTRLQSMGTRVGIVAGLIGGVAVKSVASFEQNMARARTMTDLTNDEWETLVDNIKASMGSLGITDFAVAGEAVFQAFSTGSEGVADATQDVVDAFINYKAQGTDVGTTLGFMAQQSTIFGDAAGSNTEILDRLANATIKAQSTQEQMAKALAETGPLAKAAGLNADELAGAIATLTQTTGSASTAATAFKGLLNAVLTPTAAQEEIIASLNDAILEQVVDLDSAVETWGSVDAVLASMNKRTIQFGESGVQAAGGFFPFIEDLAIALDEADINTRRIAESMEGYSAILALTGDSGAALGANTKFITEEVGRLEKQLAIMQSTSTDAFSVALAELKLFTIGAFEGTGVMSDLKVVLGTVAKELRAYTGDLAAWIEKNPEGLAELKAQVYQWGKVAVAVLAGSKALGIVGDVFGLVKDVALLLAPPLKWLAKGFAFLLVPAVKLAGQALLAIAAGPFGVVLGGLALIGSTLALFVDDWGALWDDVVEVVTGVGETIVFIFETVWEGLKGLSSLIFDAITYPFETAADYVVSLWEDVLEFFSGAWSSVTGLFDFGGQGFSSGGPVLGFATGGYVPSSGGKGTDSVPAMLSPGEFVINAPAAKALGAEFLNAANAAGDSGKAPSSSPVQLNLHGAISPEYVREVIIPMIERVQERRLGPRERSVF